jgi:hypothetical protein
MRATLLIRRRVKAQLLSKPQRIVMLPLVLCTIMSSTQESKQRTCRGWTGKQELLDQAQRAAGEAEGAGAAGKPRQVREMQTAAPHGRKSRVMFGLIHPCRVLHSGR